MTGDALPPGIASYGSYEAWLKDVEGYANQLVYLRTLPALPPKEAAPHGVFAGVLTALGITPYAHQLRAFQELEEGKNVVLATPTASGKSLVFQVPALKAALEEGSALLIFPTKALARDQEARLKAMEAQLALPPLTYTYDGDTPPSKRVRARKEGRILLTNPDMLHFGLLPRHPDWRDFLSRLRYLVVDELHYYRGVFGSHAALIFRRLLRVARHYGAHPQIIAASATIQNPRDHAETLFGEGFTSIREQFSPSKRTFAVWLPKALDKEGQVRRSPNIEAAILAEHAALSGVKTLIFTNSRKSAELIARYAQGSLAPERIKAYRAGYTPKERRALEEAFQSGALTVLVSTNALELGIDIGDLDAVILVGYPGSATSLWQRAGRAGRSGKQALVVWIPREDPLDAYYLEHPDRLVENPPEAALADPENPYIYPQHAHAAARELPLGVDEPLWKPELAGDGFVVRGERVYTTRKNPHRAITLRGRGTSFTLKSHDGKTLGRLDERQAYWEAHPGAIYLHQGEAYYVKSLDPETREIVLLPSLEDHYTQPLAETEIWVKHGDEVLPGVWVGRVELSERVVGYVKKRYLTEAVLEEVALDMPELRFHTEAMWFHLPKNPDRPEEPYPVAEALLPAGIHALEHTMIGLLPLFVIADRGDIGGVSYPFYPHPLPSEGGPTVFIYDGHPGGVGYARAGATRFPEWIQATWERLSGCACENGCPSCILSPKCGNQNRILDKHAAREIARALLEKYVNKA